MRVTRPEHARLRRLALDRGLTVSDLMRQAIASYTATDAGRADFHLGLALERTCKGSGISLSQAASFLQALILKMRLAAETEGPKIGRRRQ